MFVSRAFPNLFYNPDTKTWQEYYKKTVYQYPSWNRGKNSEENIDRLNPEIYRNGKCIMIKWDVSQKCKIDILKSVTIIHHISRRN